MKSALFIGVDISKATLDVSILSPADQSKAQYQQIPNRQKDFVQLLK